MKLDQMFGFELNDAEMTKLSLQTKAHFSRKEVVDSFR